MKKDTFKTKVQFRIFKGELLAVFPYEIANRTLVNCYAHIGQHSSCMWNIVYYSKPAKPYQYEDLFEELENLGYKLEIIQKRNHKKYLQEY
jgi:hypothetical protein